MGMLASAGLTAAFGLGQVYQVHSIWYYVVVQVMADEFPCPNCNTVQAVGMSVLLSLLCCACM